MDTVTSMRTYARVVELGGLAAAARSLGMSPAMVAKHLGNLEERTGARLLDRTTRSVRPTVAGQAYYERVVAVLDALDEAEAEAGADTASPRGRLRLTAPVEFGQEHLAPLVAEFIELHPNVSVVSDFTNRSVDLVQEGFDLAIRVAACHARHAALIRPITVAPPSLPALPSLDRTADGRAPRAKSCAP